MTAPRSRRPHPCNDCPCPGWGLECKDIPATPVAETPADDEQEGRKGAAADVPPVDHHPDHRRQHCLYCGDLSTDPTRCPGWLANRTRARFHAEAWENDAWTGIVSAHDTLAGAVVQYHHKRRRFPEVSMRLMAEVTLYLRVEEPAEPGEEIQQLLDGSYDTTALLTRSFGQERDRALNAEARAARDAARVQELEKELEAAHTARLNEPILRHCLYPGCLREFDMNATLSGREPSRPTWSGTGWVQVKQLGGYICPEHVDIVRTGPDGPGPHLPQWAHGKDGAPSTLRCACGWDSPPIRWRGYGYESWKDHVLTVTQA